MRGFESLLSNNNQLRIKITNYEFLKHKIKEMRKLLDKIINKNSGENWWKPKFFQENVLEKLPKELEILKSPPCEDKNYNCFVFALGLSDDAELIKDCGGFIHDTFFEKLISEGLLKRTDIPKDGDYILYRNPKKYPNAITHIGVVDGDAIISKWAWGPLIRHKIFDVPESYGNDVVYVKAISKEKAKELYDSYKVYNTKPKE